MRRTICLFLAAALLLAAAGCASMFDREYYVLEDYDAPSEQTETAESTEDGDAAEPISNYAALRRAIVRLVSEHTESAQLQIQNYDGAISQDISTACWEVKSSTALGAFAVDYISYDLSRIVSYYQAELHITYKRTAWQVEALEPVANLRGLWARLAEALAEGETYLVLEISAAAALTGDTPAETAAEIYYADPLVCPVLPVVETGVFPESGVSRILEIELDYGLDSETLALRREELSEGLADLLAEPEPDQEGSSGAETAEALCDALAARCTVAADAGPTAWDAIVQGTADSEGAAMAVEAAFQAAGLGCLTVSGRLDGEPHFWNIVTVDGDQYHLDITTWGSDGRIFLAGDEMLLSAGYWWDTSLVPACPAAYGETEEEPETVSEEPFSVEPAEYGGT